MWNNGYRTCDWMLFVCLETHKENGFDGGVSGVGEGGVGEKNLVSENISNPYKILFFDWLKSQIFNGKNC